MKRYPKLGSPEAMRMEPRLDPPEDPVWACETCWRDPRRVRCPACLGAAVDTTEEQEDCPTCEGTGYVDCPDCPDVETE